MKFLSFKHSGSETKILSLKDTRARISPKMQSPQLLFMGWAPMSPLNPWARHWATLNCRSSHNPLSSPHIIEKHK
jgi:hypothetical protein